LYLYFILSSYIFAFVLVSEMKIEEKSVVQILSTSIELMYSQPWNSAGKYNSTGSGFCIDWKAKKYIITNAHCVHNALEVKLRKRGYSNLFSCYVVWIVYECDLAILDVDDDEFWSDMEPLKLGKMPKKLDKVYIYGYPLGGLNVSITKGIVSRIQMVQYFDVLYGIAIQVDAAINFGNSGGPAVNRHGEIVGVSFLGEDDSLTQNMGYIIPTILINYFLQSIPEKNIEGKNIFPGLCSIEIGTQILHNEILREYVALPPDESGILVVETSPVNVSSKYIKLNDVLLCIDDKKINNDGTMLLSDILHSQGEPNASIGEEEIIPYNNYIHLKKPGDNVNLTLWRKGKRINVEFKLESRVFPIPRFEYQSTLKYIIIMGMIFLPVSFPLIKEKELHKEYVHHLIELALHHNPKTKHDEIIILSDIYASKYTEEFPCANYILESINGIKIINLKHMVEVYEKIISSKEKYIRFEFVNRPIVIILKVKDVIKHDKSILRNTFGNIKNYLIY
jgi:S1-C subfamily serine protease